MVITASLVWSLHTQKSGNFISDTLVNQIIRITLQTGALTTTFAILDVLMFIIPKNSTWQFIWDLPLGKLYTNSLLSTLNARSGWSSLADQAVDTNALLNRSQSQESRDHRRRSERQWTSFAMGEIANGMQVQRPVVSMAGFNQVYVGGDLEAGPEVPKKVAFAKTRDVRREWQ